MPTITIPEPNEKQKLFLKARQKHIAYGGARGGGKSWAIRTKAKLLALRYPGISMLIVRRTYPELEGNHIRTLKSECLGIAKYNSTDKLMTFVNGSTIKFMYCAKDGDLDRLQGLEFDIIFLDEAAQLSEYQMKAITATLRGVNDFPKRVYYTCNPGGQGHAYIKRVFVDRNFNQFENPDDYVFIQALVDDNKALMESQPEYLAQLEALPKQLREAWRFGRWDVFEGQAFPEFTDDESHYLDQRFTHVIEPFDIPAHWTIYRGFDWGYSKPFSVGYYAISDNGTMYRFKEFYGCTGEANEGVKWTVQELGAKLQELERTDPQLAGRHIYGVADPAIYAADGGESIGETLEKYGIYFEKGDHQRIPGKMQVHYRLAFGEDGRPMFYVFKTCKHFIRTIPALMYSTTHIEDIDTSMEDHCLIGSTKVWTDKGQIEIKDMVGTNGYALSSDGKYHRYGDVRLTQEDVDVFTVTLDDGSKVTATPNHRFMLSDGTWKRLDELKEGDELLQMQIRQMEEGRKAMKVKAIEYAGKADVYNMEVEDTHNFVVNGGTVVHNCYDEWRYVCMARPIAPRANVKKDNVDWRNMDDPLNMLKDKYSKR